MSDQAAKSGEWPAWARTPGDADLSANPRKHRFAETVGEPCARWVDAVAAADEIDRLRARITHLTTAIATHHATKHGSEPATARSVRSPVDRTLYEAAGTPHAVLAWDAGRDGGGAAKGEPR